MRKDAPLAVEVPASDRDKPGWVKVGVIAAVGFIIGIAWPRLMGVRLGPAAPGESAAAAASASASAQGGRAPDAPPASVVAKGPAAAATAAAAPSAAAAAPAAPAASPPNITIQKGAVLSCKTADGETKKGKECGSVPGIDHLVQPRVRRLASCTGAVGQSGKLSLVVNADFKTNKLSYDVGKSSTLPNVGAIEPCLKASFQGTSTKDAPHEHQRYTVAYSAIFGPGAASATEDDKVASKKGGKSEKDEKDRSERSAKEAPDEKKEETSEKPSAPVLASGEAQVAWEVALVRDMPKTGGLVSRLPRGTKVKVGAAKDGWFQIKFGEGYANEGWVYRGAIGR